jgi:hypothetical protein
MEALTLLAQTLWAPAETFEKISKHPRIAAPLIAIGTASFVATLVLFFRLQPPLPLAVVLLVGVLGPLLVIFIVASIFFGIFSWLGREAKYSAFLGVTAFAYLPTIFRSAASIVTLLISDPATLAPAKIGSLSPALFLSPENGPVLFAAASLIDLVSIWILTLLVIGYKFLVPADMSRTLRAAGVVSLWIVYAGLSLILTVWIS